MKKFLFRPVCSSKPLHSHRLFGIVFSQILFFFLLSSLRRGGGGGGGAAAADDDDDDEVRGRSSPLPSNWLCCIGSGECGW